MIAFADFVARIAYEPELDPDMVERALAHPQVFTNGFIHFVNQGGFLEEGTSLKVIDRHVIEFPEGFSFEDFVLRRGKDFLGGIADDIQSETKWTRLGMQPGSYLVKFCVLASLTEPLDAILAQAALWPGRDGLALIYDQLEPILRQVLGNHGWIVSLDELELLPKNMHGVSMIPAMELTPYGYFFQSMPISHLRTPGIVVPVLVPN